MAKEKFDDIRFKAETLGIIATVNDTIARYARQGYRLTLRQLYYQLIAADTLPDTWIDPKSKTKNNLKNYKRLGDIVTNGRNAGYIDWDAIEDRGREYAQSGGFDTPQQVIEIYAKHYRMDLRRTQPYHIEVMVEKDAVSNILGPAASRLGIGFTANKGYSSASAMYQAGLRMRQAREDGKEPVILYFGDHDPSGQDMTRDIDERLYKYGRWERVEVRRLALNMDQVELYNPPENPAKSNDPRFQKYANEHGLSSWELDALRPQVLVDLLRAEVDGLTDDSLLAEATEEQEAGRAELQTIAKRYQEVKEYLGI